MTRRWRCGTVTLVGAVLATVIAVNPAVASPLVSYTGPFLGFTYSESATHGQSGGCHTSHARELIVPSFNNSTGTIREGVAASSSSCGWNRNYSAEAFQNLEVLGPNWTANSTGWTTAHANMTFRWTVNMSANTGSRSGYPVSNYQLYAVAVVVDVTGSTAKWYPSSTSYLAEYTIYGTNGTYKTHQIQFVNFSIPLNLTTGHTFVFTLYVNIDVSVWMGVGNSRAYAKINMGTLGNYALIRSLTM